MSFGGSDDRPFQQAMNASLAIQREQRRPSSEQRRQPHEQPRPVSEQREQQRQASEQRKQQREQQRQQRELEFVLDSIEQEQRDEKRREKKYQRQLKIAMERSLKQQQDLQFQTSLKKDQTSSKKNQTTTLRIVEFELNQAEENLKHASTEEDTNKFARKIARLRIKQKQLALLGGMGRMNARTQGPKKVQLAPASPPNPSKKGGVLTARERSQRRADAALRRWRGRLGTRKRLRVE